MKTLILLLTLLVVGCESQQRGNVTEAGLIGEIWTVEHEGCEYVVYKSGYAGGITHKGNCKNKEHESR